LVSVGFTAESRRASRQLVRPLGAMNGHYRNTVLSSYSIAPSKHPIRGN
jgi:hypothetical protein